MLSVLLLLLLFYPIWGWAALAAWCYWLSTHGSHMRKLIFGTMAAATGTALFTPAAWGPPEGFAFFVPWGMALFEKTNMSFFSWKAPACTFVLCFVTSLACSVFGKRSRR
jgi:hypothetical protein